MKNRGYHLGFRVQDLGKMKNRGYHLSLNESLHRRTNLGDYDGAVGDCEKALKLNPRNSRAYGRLGSSHYKAGRFQLSVHAYEKALEIDPGNATYTQVRVQVHF